MTLQPGTDFDVDAPLPEGATDGLGHLFVAAGEDGGQCLEHGDLAPQIGEERGELAADGSATDDRHRRG